MQNTETPRKTALLSYCLTAVCIGVISLIVLFSAYVYRLNNLAADIFLKNTTICSTVFARPLILYKGLNIDPKDFLRELDLLRYRQQDVLDTAGSYVQLDHEFLVFKRGFRYPEGFAPPQKVKIKFNHNKIVIISDLTSQKNIEKITFDPVKIGSLFSENHKCGQYINIKDMPPLLVNTLIAMEDQNFFIHQGIDFMSLIRAIVINVRKGDIVQGGSTLTQQLARNVFFGNAKSYKRKFNEIFMSCILEIRYTKNDILEYYLNKIYLGQQGNRIIHGFGQASEYYFGRDIHDCSIHETALLVGLLKGPSYYNPFKFPERAKKRRNIVLQTMARQRVISYDQAKLSQEKDLTLSKISTHPRIEFPGVMDLVRRNFIGEYQVNDRSEQNYIQNRLRIFTTCDPIVQLKVEEIITRRLEQLEILHHLKPGTLETGVVVTTPKGCDVLAVAGGRNARFAGFNRAIDARRPVGSLIKPVYYLSALEHPDQYNLTTPLNDSVIQIEDKNCKTWSPKNLSGHYYGQVPLYEALIHSLNTASIRLGLAIGLDELKSSLSRLGFERNIPLYPSAFIGAVSMSPLEVATIYHTFSSQGLTTQPRVIQSVCDEDGVLMVNRHLVKLSFRTDSIFLLNTILQKVFTRGTAYKYSNYFPEKLYAAGKTGTSNDMRDSWFSGFTGDKLAVVWIGKDDFTTSGLTGADGALKLWVDIMSQISHNPFSPTQPETVTWITVDPYTGAKIMDKNCDAGVPIPFIIGYGPVNTISCENIPNKTELRVSSTNWLKNIFRSDLKKKVLVQD